MSRKSLTRSQRVRIFDAARGHCYLCGFKIQVGERWDAEHVKPLWLGGLDNETNMKPAHKRCHQDKSAEEAPVRAKGTRVRAKHLGIKRPRTIRAWRRFNGTPVFASRQR